MCKFRLTCSSTGWNIGSEITEIRFVERKKFTVSRNLRNSVIMRKVTHRQLEIFITFQSVPGVKGFLTNFFELCARFFIRINLIPGWSNNRNLVLPVQNSAYSLSFSILLFWECSRNCRLENFLTFFCELYVWFHHRIRKDFRTVLESRRDCGQEGVEIFKHLRAFKFFEVLLYLESTKFLWNLRNFLNQFVGFNLIFHWRKGSTLFRTHTS